AAERPFRIRLPVSTMMAVSEGINARNTNELHRQLTRQAMVTLLRRGADVVEDISPDRTQGAVVHPERCAGCRADVRQPGRHSAQARDRDRRRPGRGRRGCGGKPWTTALQALLIAERAALLAGRDEEFIEIVTLHYTGMRWGEV